MKFTDFCKDFEQDEDLYTDLKPVFDRLESIGMLYEIDGEQDDESQSIANIFARFEYTFVEEINGFKLYKNEQSGIFKLEWREEMIGGVPDMFFW